MPLGAARVTLCSEPGHEITGQVEPPDALVIDPDAVAQAWHELAVPDPKDPMVCTAELGPAYLMVLEYPDGRVVQLAGEMYGCRMVGGRYAPGGPNGGADRVLAAFGAALTKQRETIPVEVDHPLQRSDCDSFGSWITPAVGDTVAGYACSLPDGMPHRIDIPDADWAVLVADAAANSVPAASATMPTCEKAPGPTLVGVAKTGETIQWHETCGWYQTFTRDDAQLWQPGPEAAGILARIG